MLPQIPADQAFRVFDAVQKAARYPGRCAAFSFQAAPDGQPLATAGNQRSHMSRTAASRPRPLSPHLTVYRWPVTMAMSILHRATGIALYVGTLGVAWWLLAAATSEAQFARFSWLATSWLGRLVLFGYTWVLLHHMMGGIRHLVWDTGTGIEKENSRKASWATVAASVTLTLLVWAAVLFLGGR